MNGRLEAQINQTVNWTGTINYNGGGAVVFTVAAAARFPTAFLVALEVALETAVGGGVGFTITANFAEGGDGRVEIRSNTGLDFVIVWTSTDQRDVVGFTGASTSSSGGSMTGTKGMKGVWLPDCTYAGEFSPSIVGDRVYPGWRQSVGGEGDVLTLQEGDSYRELPPVIWQAVGRERALDGASASLMSWQQWVYETQRGGLTSTFVPGSPVNFYTNANTNTLLGKYRLELPPTDRLKQFESDYDAYYTVEIPRMVEDA